MQSKLFQPYSIETITLSNRIVMAPLTRRRAENTALAANEMTALYYRQHASAGLIIAEGSQISPYAFGYTGTPGCYTSRQILGWQKVTHAVHQAGGKIFLQLWHVGPFSHPLLQPGQMAPLSASPVTPDGEVLTPGGRLPYATSRAMSIAEIEQTIQDFARAAQNAIKAGFDGVEIHGAHAYLLDQFIMDGTNHRTDAYGGSRENRARFLFRVVEEILSHLPSFRVGLRLSPKSVKAGMADSTEKETYGYIVEKLNNYNLAYLHISEMMTPEERLDAPKNSIVPFYRDIFHNTLISCGGHSRQSAEHMLNNHEADLICFGKPFISNPDLPQRLLNEHPLTPWNKETFYHGGPKGYVDYPEYSG